MQERVLGVHRKFQEKVSLKGEFYRISEQMNKGWGPKSLAKGAISSKA